MRLVLPAFLLFCWFAAILAALLLYSARQVNAFDPEQRLLHAKAEYDFDENFVATLNQSGVPSSSIVHLHNHNICYCERLSKRHHKAITDAFAHTNFKPISLAVSDALSKWVPSTPAVAVIDSDNQLRYLGPYATGLGCYTGVDIVPFIATVSMQKNYHGAVVNSDAEGCFCNRS